MLYVVVIAIVNLGLGFAVAVYSGRGPWTLRQVPLTVTVDLDAEIVEEPPRVTQPTAVVTEKKKESKAESVEWQTTITPPSESDAAEPPAAEPEGPPESASATVDDSRVAEPEPVEQPTDPLREAFDEIAQRLDKYRQQIGPIEKSLFDSKVVPEIATIERQSKEVIELNHKTLRAVGSSIRLLESLEPTSDSMSAVVRAVCDAAVEFTDEIRQATEEIDAIDTTAGDGKKFNTELRPHVLKSNVASINLQNTLGVGQGFVSVAGSQGDDAETSGELPPIDQWCDRATFETALTGLWEANTESDDVSLPLAVGALDIDGVMEINQKYGTTMGDKILGALTKFMLKQRPKDTRLGKESNQRFLFLFAGTEPSDAAMKIEKIRQKIEKIRFEYRGSKIPLTASCAIVESREDDGLESLFERLDSTIQEAKNYGRNRTFLFEGDYPAPVVPPDVDVDV